MTYADWELKARRLVTCNCDYGCPCEFNGRPTRGFCEGVEAFEVIDGYFEGIRLDGLRGAGAYRWPGAVHEGGGSYLAIIDERATQEQRDALLKILGGQEQDPSSGFNIYASTIEHDLGVLYAPITFEWDLENRTGRFAVPDVLEASLEPIKNPVTGKPHRASIKLPEGFEFREAEMASSTFTSTRELPQDYANCYGFLTIVTYRPAGLVEEKSYPAVSS